MSVKVNLTALAEKLGVSKPAVLKAVKTGRIRVEIDGATGGKVYDLDECLQRWRNTKPVADAQNRHAGLPKEFHGGRPKQKTGNQPLPVAPSLGTVSGEVEPQADDEESARYFRFRADKMESDAAVSELKRQELEGLLISREEVRKDGERLGTILLGHYNALPARLAPELAAMDDQHEIHEMLVREINLMNIEIRKALGVDDGDEYLPSE